MHVFPSLRLMADRTSAIAFLPMQEKESIKNSIILSQILSAATKALKLKRITVKAKHFR